jgi:hypothetical protein
MPINKLKEYLNQMNINYSTISHPLVYTAQQVASITHIKGKKIAKTGMVKLTERWPWCSTHPLKWTWNW